MGKILTVVIGGAVFIAAFVAAQVLSGAAKPQTPQELQAQIEKEVADLKPTLPREVHPIVTWFDVEARWHTIVYKYKVRAPREVIVAKKKELETQLKGSLLLGAATMMMPKDVKMLYELYDGGGDYLYTLDLD